VVVQKKLSPTNIHHAVHLITSQKAEKCCPGHQNPQQYHQPVPFPQYSSPSPKKGRYEGCGQIQTPFSQAKHRKARLDFAYAHKDWTVDDWKGCMV